MIPIRLIAVTLTLVCCFACATSPRPEPVQFKSIHGTVVTVADGDTLTVLDSEKRRHRIRLKSVDAPEGSQAFSAESREGLIALLLNKEVEVRYEKTDQYGRVVGQVILDDRDINLQLLSDGLAWFFREYASELLPEERLTYEQAEQAARAAKRGLWASDDPIAPWEYRRSERASHASNRASREGIKETGNRGSSQVPSQEGATARRALGEGISQIEKERQPRQVESRQAEAQETGSSKVGSDRVGSAQVGSRQVEGQRKASEGVERRIIGNRRSRIYHRPDCPNYADVSPQNRVYFRTREEAQAAGYRVARNCD